MECDKEKSCQFCPDRWVNEHGTCHSTCEFYIRRTERNKKAKEALRKQIEDNKEVQSSLYRAFGNHKRKY